MRDESVTSAGDTLAWWTRYQLRLPKSKPTRAQRLCAHTRTRPGAQPRVRYLQSNDEWSEWATIPATTVCLDCGFVLPNDREARDGE